MSSYRADLAHINDAGFSDFAEGASPGVLALLRRHGVRTGLVVDLGCGSGYWANVLSQAGYDVLGVDLSPAQIALAKRRAPRARFLTESLLAVTLPPCDAVTAIGEIVNYQFDPKHSRPALTRLFRGVYKALRPGGVFIFDIATSARVPAEVPVNFWKEGPDWSLHVEVDGNPASYWLTRRIITFRKERSGLYRRSEELHRLRLLEQSEVAADLEAIGFHTRIQNNYGRFRLYPGLQALIACKPPALSPVTATKEKTA